MSWRSFREPRISSRSPALSNRLRTWRESGSGVTWGRPSPLLDLGRLGPPHHPRPVPRLQQGRPFPQRDVNSILTAADPGGRHALLGRDSRFGRSRGLKAFPKFRHGCSSRGWTFRAGLGSGAPGPPARRGHFGRLHLRFQRALEQDQAVAVRDGIGRGIPEPANLFRQGGDLRGAEVAARGERRVRREEAAALHDRPQEELDLPAGGRLVSKGDAVTHEAAVTPQKPVDLLPARPGGLPRAGLEHVAPLVFHQLVGHVQVGGVGGHVHARADAEGVDGGARRQKALHAVFVQAPAHEDLDVLEARPVEDAPDLLAQGDDIAAVQADAGQPVAPRLHLLRHLHSFVGGGHGVVGVDQQDRVGREGAGEGPEGVDLVREGRDVRVGHRPRGRDAVVETGQDVAAHGGAGDESAPGRLHPRVDTVGAPESELDHGAPAGGEDRADSLAREERLEVNEVENGRLDDLGLDDRGGDLDEWLALGNHGAFGNGADLAREAEAPQEIEEIGVEAAEGGEVPDGGPGDAEVAEIVQDVLEAGGDQEGALLRQLPREEAERGEAVHPLPEVRRGHRDLVEIREQRRVLEQEGAGDERAARFSTCRAPAHGSTSVHSRHTTRSSEITTGPTKSPRDPKAARPPSTPKNTRRKGTRVAPLMNQVRITLSTVLTTSTPHPRRSRPASGRPWAKSQALAGTYTIGAPKGISAKSVVAAPSSAGALSPAAQYPSIASPPWARAVRSIPYMTARTVSPSGPNMACTRSPASRRATRWTCGSSASP